MCLWLQTEFSQTRQYTINVVTKKWEPAVGPLCTAQNLVVLINQPSRGSQKVENHWSYFYRAQSLFFSLRRPVPRLVSGRQLRVPVRGQLHGPARAPVAPTATAVLALGPACAVTAGGRVPTARYHGPAASRGFRVRFHAAVQSTERNGGPRRVDDVRRHAPTTTTGAQRSATGTQRSAAGTQRSATGAQRSATGAQRSTTGAARERVLRRYRRRKKWVNLS